MTVASALFRHIRSALVALCGLAVLALPAMAEPALWVVKDRDSTIYLFGTVHALKPETQWLSPRIEAAIARSGELWLEQPFTTRAQMRQAMLPLVKRFGMSRERRLSSLLSPQERTQLDIATREAGLPPGSFDVFHPWFAALGISTAAMTRAGFDIEAGAEAVIARAFAARGIAPRAFETPADQVKLLTDLSEETQLGYLRAALATRESAPVAAQRFADLWAAGNTAALDASAKSVAPAQYRTLFVDRNVRWARKIETILASKGVVFIAVGASHFAGPDSIPAQLMRREIRVMRLSAPAP